jgi:hypothetical protein
MTGAEYAAAIKRLGMTKVAAANLLGVDPTTSRRWIAETHEVPQAVAITLRLMTRYNLTANSVESLMKRQ